MGAGRPRGKRQRRRANFQRPSSFSLVMCSLFHAFFPFSLSHTLSGPECALQRLCLRMFCTLPDGPHACFSSSVGATAECERKRLPSCNSSSSRQQQSSRTLDVAGSGRLISRSLSSRNRITGERASASE